VKAKGKWVYWYRAVDKFGDTLDFMLSKQRDEEAALRSLNRRLTTTACRIRSSWTKAEPTKRVLKTSIS